MICQNELLELNTRRTCWLPVDPTSPFQLCSRCDFYKVEGILKDIHLNLPLLNNAAFQRLCHLPTHRTSLLSALLRLKQTNEAKFEEFYKALSSEKFLSELYHSVHMHTPSNRCELYKYVMKTRNLEREMRAIDLPLDCWDCMAFLLRQNDIRKTFHAFSNALVTNRIKRAELYPTHIVDCMVSLHLYRKDHAARILFERVRNGLHDETKAKELLLSFLTQPATISMVFGKAASEYIPYLWNKELTPSFVQKEALKAIRKRNYVFKEDLMIKTWHPDRLFSWCFDIEEAKEFEESNSNH